MKNKLKGLLAVVLSAACFLSTTPIAGFAAEKMTVSITEGTLKAVDENGSELNFPAVSEGDEIIKADEKGMFYVTVNGEKTSENYGENAYEGYIQSDSESEKSGNTYFENYTVPKPPVGYKEGALVTAAQSSDYYAYGDAFYLGSVVNLSYSPNNYTVRFDLNSGEGTIEAINAKYDTEFTLPDSDSITKKGFIFTGWNTVSDGSGTSYAASETVKNLTDKDGSEIVLYAQWGKESEDTENEQVKKYTVSYYLSESGQYSHLQEYAEGDKITPPDSPAKEGFEFAGWIIGEENGEAVKLPETMPASNLKAYASWKIKDIKITYIIDGEEHKSSTASYGSDISLTTPDDPQKDGYVFAGWFDENGNNLFGYSTVPAEDVIFTAKWLKNGNVVYMVDKKTYETYDVTEGDKIPVPENPKKFGYKFKGWSPEVPSEMPSEDLTFTAEWELDKDFISVVVGGTVIAGGIIAAIAGTGAAAITGISIIGGIIALIGVASGINRTYTVTYKVDGNVYKTYKIEAGKKITTPADPTKNGYKFTGWTPDIPDKMPKKDLTFEATWSKIKDNSNVDVEIPSTGSTQAGIAALAALAISAAAAIIIKKKKEK